ncbi:ribonuclease HII [Tetragenococcus halophilus subsp. flandriensis]|uniref:ribonuclease HII n=1 Tax=Tetragenococcus halophilus TaxID=51669 RepID=UPI0023E9BD47|nr:ribonuclease HII [Tetragenococcus halophilus]GMA07771.1 ribonuclease HII [Tetragenococcus halophilus subsp. flandriensis]
MAKEAISEIKTHLLAIETMSDPYVKQLQVDERKGVQKLLLQLEKRLAQKETLKEQFYSMQAFERSCYKQGHHFVAGIDEVGRGPLAGPVVAAAVILPEDSEILGLNDSKQLSEKKRLDLDNKIKEQATAIGIGEIPAEQIDQVNIYQASKMAMTEAVENLAVKADHLLIDAMSIDINIPQEKIIKGDARSVSIAAASIIAKVYRDQLMKKYHQTYPYYAFDKNAGYGTKAHLTGLKEHGITAIHRKSYAPIKKYL